MDVSDSTFPLQYLALAVCVLAIWVYFIYRSKREQWGFPRKFGLFVFGILLAAFEYTHEWTYDGDAVLRIKINSLILAVVVFFLVNPKRSELEKYFIKKGQLVKALLIGGVLGLLFAVLISLPLIYYQKAGGAFLDFPTSVDYVFVALRAASEEILFRGILLGYFLAYGVSWRKANLIQALLFGLGHSIYLEYAHISIAITVAAYLLAIVFGWVAGFLVRRYQTIAGSVLMHVLVNTIIGFILSAMLPSL